ncbi:hypothetical protein [Rhizobium lusitanum]|uniref:Putative membrane protein YkoI n=1 Tax=Rhizobium lusitanum TaxID=293958 RepID=A0A7X0MFU2_9HYPH|nr:hypothetical protein [Rhizobium lusitanum]MBB6488826.1 putative membrane protein YkoI [Rhizobium lusitanum]
MRFPTMRLCALFAAIALASQFSAVASAQAMERGFRVMLVADSGDSDGSSGQDSDSGDTDKGSAGDDADTGGSDDDQSYSSEGHGNPGLGNRFDGPNGALEAVQSDRALPLDGIVAITRRLTDGQIIDTRLHTVKGVLRYELKVLENNNEVRNYSFNARTGKLVKVR